VFVLKRVRPLWIILALLLMAAIAIAALDVSGQANKTAADAGSSSADLEMASLETIKPPKQGPPVDWAAERRIRQQLAYQDKAYAPLVDRAKREIDAAGAVSGGTGKQILAAAGKYRDTCNSYADVWARGNCVTRANLARETGATRMASAELIVAGADSAKSDALADQQSKMNEARNAYAKEAQANNELSDKDKADIKASVVPRAERLITDTADLVIRIAALVNQIQSQMTPAGIVGGVASCAASGKSAEDGVTALLGPVTSLLSLAKNLASNAESLLDDTTLLTQ
jgi:hypothetical protein